MTYRELLNNAHNASTTHRKTPASEWGPSLWNEFHQRAVEYPAMPTQEDKDATYQWYIDFEHMIPCETCRTKYNELMDSYYRLESRHLERRTRLFEWTVMLHNVVNVYLHKPVMSVLEASYIHGFHNV